MARMIPDTPKNCTEASREKILFESLSRLDDEYYVFHSFESNHVIQKVWTVNETDFVIFHPQKGILVIESKAGKVQYIKRKWYYASGEEIDPIQQAKSSKDCIRFDLKERDKSRIKIVDRCKMFHAVWFPGISRNELTRQIKNCGELSEVLFLTQDDLNDPQPKIDEIFNIEIHPRKDDPNFILKTSLGQLDINFLLNYFAPSLFIEDMSETDFRHFQLGFLLKEQMKILDFLEGEKSVAIAGVAGSGKTLLAMERAKRVADADNRVLVLCYNTKLRDYLKQKNQSPYIDIHTILSLASMYSEKYGFDFKPRQFPVDYTNFEVFLDEHPESLVYKHIVVDEGQDFGLGYNRENANEKSEDLRLDLSLIRETSAANFGNEATFCIFYDKNQRVQSDNSVGMAEEIQNAEVRLTLHRNCRNTENIANTTCYSLLKDGVQMMHGAKTGDKATIRFVQQNNVPSIMDAIDSALNDLITVKKYQPEQIVILTLKSLKHSVFGQDNVSKILTEYPDYAHRIDLYREKYIYHNSQIQMTTVRKFKGLEREAVILVEAAQYTFMEQPDTRHDKGRFLEEMLFYVGASRARFDLSVVACLNDDACKAIVDSQRDFHQTMSRRADKQSEPPKSNCAIEKARDQFCELFGFERA